MQVSLRNITLGFTAAVGLTLGESHAQHRMMRLDKVLTNPKKGMLVGFKMDTMLSDTSLFKATYYAEESDKTTHVQYAILNTNKKNTVLRTADIQGAVETVLDHATNNITVTAVTRDSIVVTHRKAGTSFVLKDDPITDKVKAAARLAEIKANLLDVSATKRRPMAQAQPD